MGSNTYEERCGGASGESGIWLPRELSYEPKCVFQVPGIGGLFNPQNPLIHEYPELQTFPHEPQLEMDVLRFTQVPLQQVCWGVMLHPLPQAPQLLVSLVRSTQTLLQLISPPEQTTVQVPPEQTWLLPHVTPQPPQL
jgi:hypothetical protein